MKGFVLILFTAFILIVPDIHAEDRPIRICYFPSMFSSLTYIAKDQKFFEDEGLKVEFRETINGKLCQDEIIAGHSDFSTIADGPFVYMATSNSAAPIRIVAKVTDARGTSIVARKDKGISSIQDLKGKKLGYLPGTIGAIFIYYLMEQLHWKREDIQLTGMQPTAMVQALGGGLVDAIAIFEPWLIAAEDRLGDNAIRFPGGQYYSYQSVLITNAELLKDRPEVALKVLRVALKAERFYLENRAKTTEILSQAMKLNHTQIDRTKLDFDMKIEIRPENIRLMEKHYGLIEKNDPNFLGAKQPDFRSYCNEELLRSIAPERVSSLQPEAQ